MKAPRKSNGGVLRIRGVGNRFPPGDLKGRGRRMGVRETLN